MHCAGSSRGPWGLLRPCGRGRPGCAGLPFVYKPGGCGAAGLPFGSRLRPLPEPRTRLPPAPRIPPAPICCMRPLPALARPPPLVHIFPAVT